MAAPEEDVPMEEAAEEEEEEPLPSETFSLNLLQTIKVAQSQNGLKDSDYGRYRQFCARRLRSLYQSLKFLHGKGRYQKRKLEARQVTDVRHLLIPLFCAERAWAHANELKAERQGKAQVMLPRTRHHLLQRLAKASAWASDLAQLALVRCDTRSALEAEGYAAWMGASVLLERESDWEAALANFGKAKKLFSELAKVGDLDQQGLCRGMTEEAERSIRFCQYELGRQKGGSTSQAQQALQDLADVDGPDQGLLQSKLAALAAEAQSQQAASTSVLEWQGEKHPVQHEKVRLALHQAELLSTQILDARGGTSASGAGPGTSAVGAAVPLEAQLLPLYDRLINAYSEAVHHVRAALKAGPGVNEGESSIEALQALETGVEGSLLERTLERGELMIEDAQARFEAAQLTVSQGRRLKDKEKFARAEDLIRLHDTQLHTLHSLGELAGQLGGRQGERLSDACSARAALLQAARTFYVALALLAADKHLEALALLQRAQQRCEAAGERLEELPAAARASASAALRTLGHKVAAYHLVAQAELAAEKLRSEEELRGGVASIALQPQQPAASSSSSAFLLDALDLWEPFGGVGGKAVRVFQAPYPLQTLPMRPIMLDTASTALEYPSLKHRLRATDASKSMFSRLFSRAT